MSYEGEPNEKPKIYGDPSETGIFEEDYDHLCREYEDDLICPCCGGEVKILGGNYTEDEMTPHCFQCGWTGQTEYD